MRDWTECDIPDLSGKTALITGGASGIGFAAARVFARRHAHVIIADRNEAASMAARRRICEDCPGSRIEYRWLDLANLTAVKSFAGALLKTQMPIDILINNAGIQPIADRRTSVDGFELTFGIGHLGHFALTSRLMPLLKAARAARVVTVSSLVHGKGFFDWKDLQMERGYAAQRAYNQTKLANLLFARELHRRLAGIGSPIRSVAVHPGIARTAIGANRGQLGKFRAGDHLVSVVLAMVMPILGQSAEKGALPTLYGATSAEAVGGGFYGPGGMGETRGPPAPAKVKEGARDMLAASRLWQASENLVGLPLLR